MERTQIYLTELQHKILKHRAVDEKTTMSEQIRKAIEFYLERTKHECLRKED